MISQFQTLKVQFIAHGLVSVDYAQTTQGGAGLFWSLTKRGHLAMMTIRA